MNFLSKLQGDGRALLVVLAIVSFLILGVLFFPHDAKPRGIERKTISGEIVGVIEEPRENYYQGEVRLTVEMPIRFLEQQDGYLSGRYLPQNLRTGEVLPPTAHSHPDAIFFRVRRSPIDLDDEFFQHWERYYSVPAEGERHGLIYRPIRAGRRPEFLLKRGYFKPNTRGDYFHISCLPPIGPGSIAPPDNCGMEFLLAPTHFGDRMWGARVFVVFPAEHLADWKLIEQRARDLFENRVTLSIIE